MEVLIPLALFAAVLLAPTLAIVAFVRSERIKALEFRLEEQERRLASLERLAQRAAQPAAPVAPPSRAAAAPSEAAPPPRPEPVEAKQSALPTARFEAQREPHPAPTEGAPPAGRRAIDWEWLLGVRGAAVLGGIVLSLAAVLFFRHAFVNNWIKPPLRIGMGAAFGLGLIGLGERLQRRAFRWAPAGLEGAGIVALYATIYAAGQHYGYLNWASSLVLMGLTTGLGVLLALRNDSLFTAQLALVGGFATPLLLEDGTDRPLSTFAYLLLLNFGLLAAGRRRRWSSLGSVAFLGTLLLEGAWVLGDMNREHGWLGLGIVALFAVFFLAAAALAPTGTRRERLAALPLQLGAAAVPFLFALFFAREVDFDGQLRPVALLLLPASLGAVLVGSIQGMRELAIGGAVAPVAVALVWFQRTSLVHEALAWQLFWVAAALALAVHGLFELASGGRLEQALARVGLEQHTKRPAALLGLASLASSLAWLACLVIVAGLQPVGGDPALLPRLLGWLLFVLLLGRGAQRAGQTWPILLGAVGLGLGLVAFNLAGWDPVPSSSGEPYPELLLLLALAGGYLGLGLRLGAKWQRACLWSACLFLAIQMLVLPLSGFVGAQRPWSFLVAIPLFTLLMLTSASRIESRAALMLTYVVALIAENLWIEASIGKAIGDWRLPLVGLQLTTVLLLALWPLITTRTRPVPGAASRTPWRLAGLTPVLFLPPLGHALTPWDGLLNGAVPVIAGALVASLLLFGLVRMTIFEDPAAKRSARAWAAWSAALLWALGLAIPIDSAVAVISVALAGGLMLAGAAWIGHRGLAWFGTGMSLGATAIGVFQASQVTSYRATELPLWHALSYAHLVPAALATLGAYALTRSSRAGRLKALPIPIGLVSAAALVQAFVWMNLELANHFASGTYVGPFLRLAHSELPARNVSTSVAWGLFALGLLALGSLFRKSQESGQSARWASLALFALAIVKVFLFDLAHLEGLWRVASLLGLAVALMALSLSYQRFVFKKPRTSERA